MPIEIKELVIKAVVDDGCDERDVGEGAGAADDVERCVREVMRALRRAEER